MKHKFSSMGRVAIALVLALSLSLVMAVPVAAAAVGTPTVTLDSYLAGDTDVQHTISFDIGVSLVKDDTITITFDDLYNTPGTWADNDITIGGVGVLATKVSTNGDIVTITLRASIDTADNPVVVVFTSLADIDNPIAGTAYTLDVETSVETAATSASYSLYDAPVITSIEPNKGNVGDTMWVEVKDTGNSFVGNADTNASTTTLDFGTGIDVVSTKYIGTGEIDCQITINAVGTPLVVGTTAAITGTITGTEGQTFTANSEGTQVDVWNAYDVTADIFDVGTLIFDEDADNPFDTITDALGDTGTEDNDVIIVHADTYDATAGETFPITIADDITLQSLSGAALTTIDVSEAQDTTSKGAGIEVTADGVTISGFTIIGVPTVTDSTAIGFTVSSGDYPTIKATTGNNIVALTVEDCIFNAPSAEVGHAALLVDADVDGVSFLDNEVTNYIYGVIGKAGVDTLVIQDNIFNQSSYLEAPDWGTSDVTMYLAKGVQVFSTGGTGLQVIDNNFTGPATLAGEFDTDAFKDIFAILGGPGSDSIYTGNTITNYFCGIFARGGGKITENDIDACTVGIQVGQRRADSEIDLGDVLEISENNITNSLNRGIWVQPTTPNNAVTVKYNTIAGNADYGLTSEIMSGTATAGSDTTLTDTSLEWDLDGSTLWGKGFVARGVADGDRVVNVTTGLTATVESGGVAAYTLKLDNPSTSAFTFSAGDSYRVEAQVNVVSAKYNWWGHIGGPSADAGETAPLGSGDVLSSQMGQATSSSPTLYDPWLTEPQATVIADGVRSYGSNALALEEGWNTLSVPCGLKSTANTFGEIIDLGTYLVWEGTAKNYLGGYWYDASPDASPEGPLWKGIDNDTTLEPGKGFYVKMSSDASFPVLYFDGSVNLPAYDMYAGWNLIGSMFGIDKTVADGDWGVADIDDTDEGEGLMYPLYALVSIQIPGSVVISPSVPGQGANVWVTTVSDPDANTMLVGEAYWVFMDANATLAGFEVTPFCFTPGDMP